MASLPPPPFLLIVIIGSDGPGGPKIEKKVPTYLRTSGLTALDHLLYRWSKNSTISAYKHLF
jgi:hypothetical protein